MNGYGKKSNKATAKEAETGEEQVDMKKYKSYTFFSFAAQIIQNNILDSIKTDSHIVRIPISQQNKERKETGRNTRSQQLPDRERDLNKGLKKLCARQSSSGYYF